MSPSSAQTVVIADADRVDRDCRLLTAAKAAKYPDRFSFENDFAVSWRWGIEPDEGNIIFTMSRVALQSSSSVSSIL